jgi:LysR family transcriptional regulator, hypochlorite-specific transcription factor HypT
MQLKWLEDFIAVASAGSFAAAATARNVTQPAFGRRIKALEDWLGAPLIERNAFPAKLTEVGTQFLVTAQDIVVALEKARRSASNPLDTAHVVRIATGRTLGQTLFPPWLVAMQQILGSFPVQISSGSLHEALTQLEQNAVDLVFCYGHPCLPLALEPSTFATQTLGQEQLVPVSAPNKQWPDSDIPFLALASTLALGRIWSNQVPQAVKQRLKPIYQADFAEPLLPLVKAGLGQAWLPASLVKHDLLNGQLVQTDLTPPIAFDVQLIRATNRPHAWVDLIWSTNYLTCAT